jgi:hypothetical protein
MTWFKVDDSLAFHAKVVRAGNPAMGLWVRAGAWCAQQLNDGLIPGDIARALGKPSEIKRLVSVGLWEIDGDSFRFHDWFQSNPSRVEVEARRAVEAKKKADARARRAGQTTLSPGDSPRDTEPTPPGNPVSVPPGVRSTRPDPTRPSSKEENPSGGDIVATWIDSLNRRPPGSVIGQVGKHAKALLAEGFTEKEILEALAAMSAKGLNPSTLPSLVNEVVNRTNVRPINGNSSTTGRRQQVMIGPDYWRDVSGDEVTIGRKTRWV